MTTLATTAEAVRDRAIALVEAIVPDVLSGDRFRAFRNEAGADFEDWCEAHPAACRRRFQIRDTGDDEDPAVTDTVTEEKHVTFRVLVAYPHSARDGVDQALDRDDTMASDLKQLELAIGMYSRASFSPPYPDACWLRGESDVIAGTACDWLEMRVTFMYQRTY